MYFAIANAHTHAMALRLAVRAALCGALLGFYGACGTVTESEPDSSPGPGDAEANPDATSAGAGDAGAGDAGPAPALERLSPARTWPDNPAALDLEVLGSGFTGDMSVIWDAGGDEEAIAPASVESDRLEVTLEPSLWADRGRGAVSIAAERDGQRSSSIDFALGGVLPDTGQSTCYTEDEPLQSCPSSGASFAGQDAQFGWDLHVEPAERYEIDGTPSNPVVVDRLTDLEWQGCVLGLSSQDCTSGGEPSTVSNADANDACDELSWGGRSDWRLPSLRELASILHLERSSPSVDEAFFPETPFPGGTADAHWTSTAIPGFDNYYWTLYFDGGGTIDAPDDRERFVRCVRGEAVPAADFVRLGSTSGEPVVRDRATGLVWQGCSAGQSGDECGEGDVDEIAWEDALAFCDALDWDGHGDWRVPDVNELTSLVDFDTFGPSIDEEAFPQTEDGRYWSSTTAPSLASAAFYLDFSTSKRDASGSKATSSNRHVRCVRAGLAPPGAL